MVQVIPREPSLGEILGSGLGAGVQTGLQGILEQKAQQGQQLQKQLQEQQRTQALAQAAGIDPGQVQGVAAQDLSQLIRSRAEEMKALAKSEESQRAEKVKLAGQRSGKVLERADTLREAIPAKENALRFMTDAIQEGDLGFFSGNNLAELTGVEAFRTAKGAQLITAGKEFFLNSIQRAGARPNIFVEKQIAKMMPLIGRNKEANLTAAALLGADLDVEKARVDITDQVEQEYLDRQGFAPANIGALVTQRLRPIAQQRQNQLVKELSDIQKSPEANGETQIRVQLPNGQTGLIPKERLKEFLKLGAKKL